MAHYRQVLDSDFEKLSALKTDKKFATNSATEHAILGLQGLETESLCFDTTSTESTSCNKIQEGAKAPKLPILTPTGIEPVPRP